MVPKYDLDFDMNKVDPHIDKRVVSHVFTPVALCETVVGNVRKSKALFSINVDDFSNSNLGLIRNYSRYKYGDAQTILIYVQALTNKIKLENDISDIFLVTPPYSSVESAVIALARSLAASLNVPHGELRAYGTTDKQVAYATLQTQHERLAARNSVTVKLETLSRFNGMRAILLDDMETTGSTFMQMEQVINSYHISVVRDYSIAILETDNPSDEELINTFSLRFERDALIEIINSPHTNVNRHTLKSIFSLPKEEFFLLISKLNSDTKRKLYIAASVYYKGDINPSLLENF